MSYKCARCKRPVDIDITKSIRCPYCGHRIFIKDKPTEIVKVIKTE